MTTDTLTPKSTGLPAGAPAKGRPMMATQASSAHFAGDGKFDLTTFFEGRTHAWGIFEDRFGRLRRRFSVAMEGRWHGDTFVIDEDFVYDTGETEHRSWSVRPERDGSFRARASDCIGEAIGSCDSERIHMTYKLRLQLSDRSIVVDFDDKIYAMGEGRAVNRAIMRKWGIKLGELSLFFVRESQ